jgi:hypothetical protein
MSPAPSALLAWAWAASSAGCGLGVAVAGASVATGVSCAWAALARTSEADRATPESNAHFDVRADMNDIRKSSPRLGFGRVVRPSLDISAASPEPG